MRDRKAMISELAQRGIDMNTLRGVTDEALEHWLESLEMDKVQKYAARNRKAFAEAGGGDSQELVRAFAALQRRDKSTSAAKFLERGAGVSMGGVPDQATRVPASQARLPNRGGSGDVDPGQDADKIKPRADQTAGSKSTAGLVSFAELREGNVIAAHYRRFSETFSRVGTTEAELLAAYRSARRCRPALTAEAFLAGR